MNDIFHNLDLPDLSGGRIVLDANICISQSNNAKRFLQAIGNPEVYQTDIIAYELRKHCRRLGMNKQQTTRWISRSRRAFNSTMLPRTRRALKIARRISKTLRLAEVPKETVKAEKNDALIAAHAMLYGINVLIADRLFWVTGQVAALGIDIYLTSKNKPEQRSQQMRTILHKKGIETPVDLSHLVSKIKNLPQVPAPKPRRKETEET